MGGRGSKSPQAKRHVANVSSRALLWAKTKIGSRRYGRGAWNGTFFFGTAKCNLFVEHAFIMEIQKKSLSHLHHPGLI